MNTIRSRRSRGPIEVDALNERAALSETKSLSPLLYEKAKIISYVNDLHKHNFYVRTRNDVYEITLRQMLYRTISPCPARSFIDRSRAERRYPQATTSLRSEERRTISPRLVRYVIYLWNSRIFLNTAKRIDPTRRWNWRGLIIFQIYP